MKRYDSSSVDRSRVAAQPSCMVPSRRGATVEPARVLAQCLTLVVLATPLAARAQTPDDITTPNEGYVVRYNDDNPYTPPAMPGDDMNYVPMSQAQSAADSLDRSGSSSTGNPAGYHPGYVDLGFMAPDFDGSDRETFIFDCNGVGDCDSGNAPADRINLPAPTYIDATDACIRGVIGHELFHHVQYAYIDFDNWSGWGNEPVEGTARMMQDKIYTDLDGNAGCITYRSQVNNYLGDPNRNLWTLSYTTALFWNYLAERLGPASVEPSIGTDVIMRFWELAGGRADSPDFLGVLRQTVTEFDSAETLENVFHDFTIANVAKDLDLSPIADGLRYRYIDEHDAVSGSYNQAARAWTGTIPPDRAGIADDVVAWGAKYYEANISAGDGCRNGVVGFRGEGDIAAYGLMAVQGSQVQRLIKGRTGNFRHSFLQRAKQPYTRLIASVAGLDEAADFTYTFACGPVQMAIVEPTSARQAYVGTFDAPERFLVRLIVTGPTSLGTPTVEGLEPSDFRVFVGPASDPANEAPVISAAHVQGEYWIVAQAPTKPANGVFDLTVQLPEVASATNASAVNYAVQTLDQVLVLDRSGSMLSPSGASKLDAAKNAATLFVDAAGSDDQLGVVTFGGDNVEPNDDATLARILQPVTDAQRNMCRAAIGGIFTTPNVLTSIGDGLDKGGDEFPIRGSALGEDWLVLLSDGMQNEAQYWSTIRPAIQAAGIKVNAIALGPLTDQTLLQNIADDTGGIYYYVDVGSVASGAPSAAPSASGSDLPNDLSDAFALATERVQRLERLWEASGVALGARSFAIDVAEGGIEEARFAFNWTSSSDKLDVKITRPDGTPVVDGVAGARIYTTPTHVVVHVPLLAAGSWGVSLSPVSGSPTYFAVLQGRQRNGTNLTLQFAQTHGDKRALAQGGLFLRGLPMPIVSSLNDSKGPILGADIEAVVEHPDGTTILLPLLDDGSHGDGVAGDGVYANKYTRTTDFAYGGLADGPNGSPNVVQQRGSYAVRVTARGLDSQGQRFTRIRKGAFNVTEVRDSSPPIDADGDGMPTRYEVLHSCMRPGSDDRAADPDFDELANEEEWKLGTDPCSPDTDRGGESDRSELGRGANPFDQRDDALPRPVHVEVIDWKPDHQDPAPELRSEENLLRFPVHPAYARMRVLRSTSPNGPFVEVAQFDPKPTRGLYYDAGLTNDVTYYYQLQALDLNGRASAPSVTFSGTPRKEPTPPLGWISIERGAAITTSTNVTLNTRSDKDAVEMRFSNVPTFAGSVFVPFAPKAPWTLAPNAAGVATVYAQFRDEAGNVSRTYQDDIRVQSPMTVGGVRGVVKLPDRGSFAGVFVKPSGSAGEAAPVFTASDGSWQVTGLKPGRYQLLFERPGYVSQVQTVSVRRGAVLNLGTLQLEPAKR
jgi:von Willebrand factor type A domain/Carboxypeptidase regulatory-like domain